MTDAAVSSGPIPVPQVTQNFGFAGRLRQTAAIGWVSFLSIAKSPAGLIALTVIAALVVLILPLTRRHMEIPLLPRTGHLLNILTAPLANPANRAWMIIPLLVIFYAGELVWREREVCSLSWSTSS